MPTNALNAPAASAFGLRSAAKTSRTTIAGERVPTFQTASAHVSRTIAPASRRMVSASVVSPAAGSRLPLRPW
jgi:hypothetical protein